MHSASIVSRSNSPASATAAPPSLPGLSPRRTRGYSSSPTEGRRGERASLRDADSCDRHPCFLPTRLFPFHSPPSIPPWWGRAGACPGCDPGDEEEGMGQYIGVPQAMTREAGNSNTGHSGRRRPGYGRAHGPRKTDIRGSIRDGEVSVRNLRKGVHAPTSPHLLEGQRNLSSQG